MNRNGRFVLLRDMINTFTTECPSQRRSVTDGRSRCPPITVGRGGLIVIEDSLRKMAEIQLYGGKMSNDIVHAQTGLSKRTEITQFASYWTFNLAICRGDWVAPVDLRHRQNHHHHHPLNARGMRAARSI